ncbi:hypothetical protein Tco_0173548 [Tanacetum coccineum]
MTFINANVLSNLVSLQYLSSWLNALLQNTMAEQNVPAQPPTRTDEQIKGISITPVNPAHPFEVPPSGDTVIDFVNELGYPEPVEIVSSIRKNLCIQPWRAYSLLANHCLTERLLAVTKPMTPSSANAVLNRESVEVFGNAIPDPTDNDASFNNPRIIPTYQTLPIETGPSSQPNDETSEKVIHESSSTSDSERTESETEAAAPKGDQDQGEVDSFTVTSGVSIHVSDPEKAHEALAGPDLSLMKKTDWIRLWKIYMCLLLDQTLSTWMKNSSPQPTQ